MQGLIAYFQKIIHFSISSYFKQGGVSGTEIIPPDKEWLYSVLPQGCITTPQEEVVLLLALMPHISPQVLDLFFLQNKELDRPYTEFGGWKGSSHGGFLPTGQTALFLIENGLPYTGKEDNRSLLLNILDKEHWFYRNNILYFQEYGEGEPFLSGKILVSEEFLSEVLRDGVYRPEYSMNFPAKRITTPLGWSDLVLPYNLREEINDIICWLSCQQRILELWELGRIIKPGYRCLFYGPPGTGKTLTAALLGKHTDMDVYRVDLSMIVSKYIGETEKNLAKVFDKAEHNNWILFFDEADALFGQRTETQTSNDRHANQEVAYLLQRIEDFPGMVILATNMKENIDEAFFRRFQSVLYFPLPDRNLRFRLWQNMLPAEWMGDICDNLLHIAAEYKLSGGSIVNVIQSCAIKLYGMDPPSLTEVILKQALVREQMKEGKIIQE